MKTILLWDPRFRDRRPARLTVEDSVASAAVRAGVAAAANPAEAGALSAGGVLDPTMLTEVVLQHGNGGAIRRVFLPYSVVMVGALAGVLAAIGTPIPGGVTPTPSPTPTPTPMPSPHQLVAPTLASSTAIDSTSAALQIGLLYDPLLPDPDGYLGFAVKLERATNAGFTAALVTDTILINTPYFDEGVSSREIMHSLTPGVTYYYRASVLPPSDNADYTASPVSNTVPVPIAVGVATTFDVPNSGAGFTFSNSNRTVTSTAGSSAGQTAVVSDAHAQQTGKWWFECRLDVAASNSDDYQVIGLAMSGSGAGPDFFYSGTGTFRCDNQINFVTPIVSMPWKTGSSVPETLFDSEITLAAGRVGFAIDQGDETNGSTRLAVYIKNRKTAFNICFAGNEAPVRPYASIKQPGQITLVPTSVKPAGYQDWKTA